MAIRQSVPADEAAIRTVNIEAFKDDPSSAQTEHLIVDELRAADALELSLVAEVNGALGGHIAVSPVTIGETSSGWFLFGPLAVLPEWQREDRDNASLLVLAAINTMQMARRAAGGVAIGDPAVYGRYGFARKDGVTVAGVPDENVLCRSFTEAQVPVGEVKLNAAFSAKA